VRLAVRNVNGELTPIPQLPVMEAWRTLGVRVSLDGNNAVEFVHLTQIATEWFTVMKAGQLTHEAADFSLHNIVLKQLEYPLVMTMLMERECNAIMQPILGAGLPAMGIVQMMARTVVHGPLQYRGLDIPNLYMEQLIACLQTLLQYGPQPEDVTDSLIQYMAEAFRLKMGVAGEVINALVALAPAVTDLWIKACWADMAQHDIHITYS